MDFNKRAMEYITNEKEMLEVLEKISEQMKKRAEMERQEPSLLALRCFSLELRDIEEVRKKKEAENKRKADDERIRAEKKKEGKTRMEDLERSHKKRGGPPPSDQGSNLDSKSSGQVV
jgi:hypothetical protein